MHDAHRPDVCPLVDIDILTDRVIGCAIEVHRTLGPGLLESIYRDCLLIELRRARLRTDRERLIDVTYKGQLLTGQLRVDIIVEQALVLEVKAVEHLHPVHLAQVITYLKISNFPAGLLLNFNATSLRAGLRRLNRPDLHGAAVARHNGTRQTDDSGRGGTSSADRD